MIYVVILKEIMAMKHKFLKDLGIEIDDDTQETLNQFDLNGFMDQISDDRLKEEEKAVVEAKEKIENDEDDNDSSDEEEK